MGDHPLDGHLIIVEDISETVCLLLGSADQNDAKPYLQPLNGFSARGAMEALALPLSFRVSSSSTLKRPV